ncbi:Retrovirus-related Pol polyprotein from transposon [Dictyocoela muelleri]|nr:Retrovirus-related Pol polyprotein from transposon [Dictyocoela muelleri]
MILKKNNEIRIVVDYRDLQYITKIDPFPNPRVYSVLRGLNGASDYSTIDINYGYHQFEFMRHIEKTIFTIMAGHYKYTRMPFGLSNAPKTFQRVMISIFDDFNF